MSLSLRKMENTPKPKEMNLVDLPEECIAKVISLTTPVDACRMSVVAQAFRSAAESDTVWNEFLPSDYASTVSSSGDGSDLMSLPSKKQLFVSLCHNPILVEDGTKSFWLDKRRGKKCYMIAAEDLVVAMDGTPEEYFSYIRVPDSRFNKVARFRYVEWLEINGEIDTFLLSPATTYIACLVFKIETDAGDLGWYPSDVTVGVTGGTMNKSIVCLDPTRRNDGWFEIELGEYFNGNAKGKHKRLEMCLVEYKKPCQIIVQGIEIRPKSG